MKLLKILITAIAGTLIPTTSNGMILISNWENTSNTISFDISGTIDASPNINDYFYNQLTIISSEVGSPAWVSSSGFTYEITNNGSGHRLLTEGFYVANYPNYIRLIIDPNDWRTWQAGDSLDASITLSGGSLFSENLRPETMVVTGRLGINEVYDPQYRVGQIESAAVPEPSSSFLFLLSTGIVLVTRRR